MSKEKQPRGGCPWNGDNTNCQACAYYPDYAWDNKIGDCVRQDDLDKVIQHDEERQRCELCGQHISQCKC